MPYSRHSSAGFRPASASVKMPMICSSVNRFFIAVPLWNGLYTVTVLNAGSRSSRPGKPTDNAKNESFNGRFREECLNAHWFLSLEDVRRKIEVWREYYNEARPHSALQWMTPAEFARQCVPIGPVRPALKSRNFPTKTGTEIGPASMPKFSTSKWDSFVG